MELKAGKVHFLGRYGRIEAVKTTKHALMKPSIDLRAAALFPEFGKGLALEGLYHERECNLLADICQRFADKSAMASLNIRCSRQPHLSSHFASRFSMNAQMPSSASRAIMFSVITSEA